MTEPKPENMDGNTFDQWLERVAINLADILSAHPEQAIRAFNANYYPRTFAAEICKGRVIVANGGPL